MVAGWKKSTRKGMGDEEQNEARADLARASILYKVKHFPLTFGQKRR